MEEIIIVYYIYINPKSNWRKIIKGQINDLRKFKLLPKAKLYIYICDTIHIGTTYSFVEKLCPDAKISFSIKNNYEYGALKLLHDLSFENKDALFIYFHTKGMSYNKKERITIEKALLCGTFSNWKNVYNLMNKNPLIKFSGLFPEKNGEFIWFNFFYVKSSWLRKLEKPLLSDNRYIYEVWLRETLLEEKNYNFYNIYENKINLGYSQNEVFHFSQIISNRIENKKLINKLKILFYRVREFINV